MKTPRNMTYQEKRQNIKLLFSCCINNWKVVDRDILVYNWHSFLEFTTSRIVKESNAGSYTLTKLQSANKADPVFQWYQHIKSLLFCLRNPCSSIPYLGYHYHRWLWFSCANKLQKFSMPGSLIFMRVQNCKRGKRWKLSCHAYWTNMYV